MIIDVATATVRLTAEEQQRCETDAQYQFLLLHKLGNLCDDTRKTVSVLDAETGAVLVRYRTVFSGEELS